MSNCIPMLNDACKRLLLNGRIIVMPVPICALVINLISSVLRYFDGGLMPIRDKARIRFMERYWMFCIQCSTVITESDIAST